MPIRSSDYVCPRARAQAGSRNAPATLLGFIGLLLLGGSARASETAAHSCAASGPIAQVAAVVDDLDLALEDGRTLRLAGVDPVRATPTRPTLGEDARRDLERQLVGREVMVQSLSPTPDRWERFPALVAVPPLAGANGGAGTPNLLVNETLIEGGWARARPDPFNRSCLPAFLALETKARGAGLGLWADPYYAVADPDDRDGLLERTGTMALVEGRLRPSLRRGRLFLRLGLPSADFVVTVAPRVAKILAGAGIDPNKLAGSRVRIRGFLDDRFGPRIDLSDPGQIEVLEGAEPAGLEHGPRSPEGTGEQAGAH